MDNSITMSDHSNLMLVDIIYGNSGKYNQDDVLAAELELSTRNVSFERMEVLKEKVAYIGGINVPGSNTSSSDTSSDYDNASSELEGSDSVLVKVLIGYIALSSFGALIGVFQGSIKYSILSLLTLGINVYGIYGLLNRQKLPVLLLVGLFSYVLVSSILSTFSLMVSTSMAYAIGPLFSVALTGAILYFLTKPSMRLVYDLDGESIRKAIGIGAVVTFLLRII